MDRERQELAQIANSREVIWARDVVHDGRLDLYRMWFGVYQDVVVYVWADSFDDAFEEAVEWLDEQPFARYHFTDIRIPELKEAAEDLGIKWKQGWNDLKNFRPDEDDDAMRVFEHAETDLTLIGHTTLKHGQYVRSDEWGGDDVTDQEEWNAVVVASLEEIRQTDPDYFDELVEEKLEPNVVELLEERTR